MSGPFVKQGIPGSQKIGGKKVKGFRGVHLADDDVSEYRFGEIQGGTDGTRVPRMSKRGGIQGSDNPHGTAVMGSKLTCGADGAGFEKVGEVDVQHLQKEPDLVEEDPEEVPEEVEAEEWDEEAVAEEIEELQNYVPPQEEETPRTVPVDLSSFKFRGETIPVPQGYGKGTPKKRIKMSGEFGTYRGKYTHLVETDELVVLLYDLLDPVYSPPPADKAFTISCGKESHKVYFAGIEFELDFLGQGVQVFVKTE
jgi:hypothetical protein